MTQKWLPGPLPPPPPIFRGFAKGRFPKGWFWRMFPRNENRNEGTFAKTTLLETALLSPSAPFWCWQKGGFQKGGFGGCSPGTKTGTRVRSPKPPFYETALLSPSEFLLCREEPCSKTPERLPRKVGLRQHSALWKLPRVVSLLRVLCLVWLGSSDVEMVQIALSNCMIRDLNHCANHKRIAALRPSNLNVNSQYLNCETITSLLIQSWPICSLF